MPLLTHSVRKREKFFCKISQKAYLSTLLNFASLFSTDRVNFFFYFEIFESFEDVVKCNPISLETNDDLFRLYVENDNLHQKLLTSKQMSTFQDKNPHHPFFAKVNHENFTEFQNKLIEENLGDMAHKKETMVRKINIEMRNSKGRSGYTF